MHLSREGNDLVITFKGIDDTIRIKEQFSNRYHIVESFEFADGITVTSDELYGVPLVIKGKGTIKDFTSGYGNRSSILIGSDEEDTIYAYDGNDTLDGGSGNDQLYDGNGNDVYLFGEGYGNDTIYEDDYYDNDTVRFGKGLEKEDMQLNREGNDLIISFKGHDDTLRIDQMYYSRYHIVETFEFSDGTVLTSNDLFSTPLTIIGSGEIKDFTGGFGTRDTKLLGSDKDDSLYGYSGNDTLDGGEGDDYLAGGNGNYVYLFGIDSGNDSVYEDDYYDTDTVLFGEGLKYEDIQLIL